MEQIIEARLKIVTVLFVTPKIKKSAHFLHSMLLVWL